MNLCTPRDRRRASKADNLGPQLRFRPLAALLLPAAGACLAACTSTPRNCPDARPQPGATITCDVPGYEDRPYILHIPTSWNGSAALPLIVAFHGGGSNPLGQQRLTCPPGDSAFPCLDELGDREGFATVYPSGRGSRLAPDVRTWNAGGGVGPWQCVSGRACEDDVDDIAYVSDLLETLAQLIPIDEARVFATGMSNGAAMSHRVACEMSRRFAAIAAVAGTNQLAAAGSCSPAHPIGILQIHGTTDPCWTYETSSTACLQSDGKDKLGVAPSMAFWAAATGCALTTIDTWLDDPASDGTRGLMRRYQDCPPEAPLVLVDVIGGGHTWPGGIQYFSENRIGIASQDFSANELMWAFFQNVAPRSTSAARERPVAPAGSSEGP